MTPSATLPGALQVTSVRPEAEDTWTLDLDAGAGGFAFEPGQFTMLYSFGVGEVPISISGDPTQPGRLVHTVRAVGPTTRSLCAVGEGEWLGVRGPFGRGWPVERAEGRDLLLVAGGLGLAPLRPALYAALADRGRFGRVILLYGSRDPAGILFDAELERWRSDEPLEVMMRFTVDALLDAGVAPGDVFVSLERNMRCAVGHCGHCQLGGTFICRDGPVFAWPEIERFLAVRDL